MSMPDIGLNQLLTKTSKLGDKIAKLIILGKSRNALTNFTCLNWTVLFHGLITQPSGSKEKIIDLMRLMKDSGNVNSSLYGEMIEFGCRVPNCREKIWTITKTESFNFKQDGSRIDLDFSSSKVSNHYLCTIMNPDF